MFCTRTETQFNKFDKNKNLRKKKLIQWQLQAGNILNGDHSKHRMQTIRQKHG